MEKTKYYSFRNKELCKGCQLCVQGRKLVLFVTGVCPRKCWYCSIGDNKWQKDIAYANERPITNDSEIIKEARLCEASGAGLTGGDPLTDIIKTIHYIQLLKKEFGASFHIHLYTSLNLLNQDTIKKLEDAGLDEIRIHPDLENAKDWKKIETLKINIGKGVEIPLILKFEKETINLIEYFKDKINFFNLNELETADNSQSKVIEKGYRTKDELSYAIEGSEEMGKAILEKYADLNMHLCTAKLKDAVQLAKRIKLRAKNVKKEYDTITEEGALIRGAIYTEKPSFHYRDELKKKNKEEEIKKLKAIRNELATKLRSPKRNIDIDELKYRFLCSPNLIRKNITQIKKMGLIPAIVEEYPTYDAFEIEIEFL